MDPPSKRRRLAPKASGSEHTPSHAAPSVQVQDQAQPAPDPRTLIPPERHDFESFARHLQDAAIYISHQMQRPAPKPQTVLLLSWEGDEANNDKISALDKVFRDKYQYGVERWKIPKIANPLSRLAVQVSSFLENSSPDIPKIIYYTGASYLEAEDELYWTSGIDDSASRVRWTGLRCLIENSQSDVLFLLDTGIVKDIRSSGTQGIKSVIASHTITCQSHNGEQRTHFTEHLTQALETLVDAGHFTAVQLHDGIVKQWRNDEQQTPDDSLTPLILNLTTADDRDLTIKSVATSSPHHASTAANALNSMPLANDSTFNEARVLVCTTFVGDASPDMAFFDEWIHSTPPIASQITMEGMFLGPPTMLLISMPQSIWSIVQHDKVCCFIGYINSHNMIDSYKRLVGPTHLPSVSAKAVEDGRILLEAREAAASSPYGKRRLETYPLESSGLPETPTRAEARNPLPNSAPSTSSNFGTVKNDVEDSAEMKEAAEQLKALSHVRHLSDGSSSARQRASFHTLNGIAPPQLVELAVEGTNAAKTVNGGAAAKPGRQFIPKIPSSQETRCTFCSHTPFKDASSLRKHVAAAHTRPFPCAFSFAGCESTFGSKNEWKRHIASQHLCLQCYRCSTCQTSHADYKGNEFNRKDLFTQHLRRMHAPFPIKKALAKGDAKLQADWEIHVKEMQQACLVTRRLPPQRASCPKDDCQSTFEGSTSWDEWTEHVGRHMEKGEGQRLGVDRLLAEWALDEGIIESKGDGEYRLTAGLGGTGNGNGSGHGNGHGNGNGNGTGAGHGSGAGNGTGINGITNERENDMNASMVSEASHVDEDTRSVVAAA